jgi:hypothetical protein
MSQGFRPRRIFEVLAQHDVRFVVIGGIGARLRGSPIITNDTDVCYARDDANLERLAAALRELNARLRGAPEDVPFLLDAKSLKAGDHFTFVSSGGSFDCLGTPAGVSGYEALENNAATMDFQGTLVRVASIDDLIRMKLAAGRPKDLEAVETLAALREELEERDER